MPIKIYEYKNCTTCQKALKFLDAEGVSYERRPIVEQPPTRAELEQMLLHLKNGGGSFKNLFNVSGQLYRELGIAERLKGGMGEQEALDLLAKNGKLIKRPFLLADKTGVVGFKENLWRDLLNEF